MTVGVLDDPHIIRLILSIFILYADKPGPPVNVRISHHTPHSVTLQWDPPKYDGGSLVNKYEVTKKHWGQSGIINVEETLQQSFTFDNLSQSDEYQFGVCAVNNIGKSESMITYIKEMSELND